MHMLFDHCMAVAATRFYNTSAETSQKTIDQRIGVSTGTGSAGTIGPNAQGNAITITEGGEKLGEAAISSVENIVKAQQAQNSQLLESTLGNVTGLAETKLTGGANLQSNTILYIVGGVLVFLFGALWLYRKH